jgi:hypothetical protein
MARRWRTVVGTGLGAALFVGACSGGQSGGEVTTNEPPAEQGQGGQGAPECEVDEDCRAKAEDRVALASRSSEGDARLSPLRCDLFNGVPSCTCQRVNRPYRVYQLGPGPGCYIVGRTGNCLFGDADFETCQLYERRSCDASCARLEARLNEDAARTVEAELVDFACLGSYCRTVVSLDGRCFVDNEYEYTNRSYDCALDSKAILEQRASCGDCLQSDQCIARAITCNARGLIDEPGCGCP